MRRGQAFNFPIKESVMPEDKIKRGPADRRRIDVTEPHELRYWVDALSVSADELKAYVSRVGPGVANVRLAIARDKVRSVLGQVAKSEKK